MFATEAFEAVRTFEQHEHRELARGLGRIHEVGNVIGSCFPMEKQHLIREVVTWADETLGPHIAWEESWLYPQIELLTRTPWSTHAARYDHGQIAALIARLRMDATSAASSMTPGAVNELRCHLFALEALLGSHIDREEKLLLPVLGETGLDS